MMKRHAELGALPKAAVAMGRPVDVDAGQNRFRLGRSAQMIPSPYLAMLRELAIFHQQIGGGGRRRANR